MKLVNVISLVIVIVFGGAGLAIWFTSSVQDFTDSNTNWNGIRDFNEVFNIVPIDDLNLLRDDPAGITFVSIPYLPYSEKEIDNITEFINHGGVAVIMDDFGYGNSLLEHTPVTARFDGRLLLDPLFCDQNPVLPRAISFTAPFWEIGVEAVTLNRGTVLAGVEADEILATSSPNAFLDIDRNGVQDPSEPGGEKIIAARYHVGSGLIVLVSDPSIVINSMISKTDNMKFMDGLLHPGDRNRSVLLDRSHLVEALIDVSKTMLAQVKHDLATNPHFVVILVVVITSMVSINITWRGK